MTNSSFRAVKPMQKDEHDPESIANNRSVTDNYGSRVKHGMKGYSHPALDAGSIILRLLLVAVVSGLPCRADSEARNTYSLSGLLMIDCGSSPQ
jgi:hypothetical protein